MSQANLVPLPRKKYFSNKSAPSWPEQIRGAGSDVEFYEEQTLEKVLWQETLLDDSYEKVTF